MVHRSCRWLMPSALILLSLADIAPAWAEFPEDRRFMVEFETGAIWQSRNEIQIPDSSDGTRFSLASIQGSQPQVQRRVEATWNVAHRHAIRFVYQPLGFDGTGTFGQPVRFAGGNFGAGIPVDSELAHRSHGLHQRCQSRVATR